MKEINTMKTSLTLTLALALLALGSVSWASTKLNSLTNRLVFEKNVANPMAAETTTVKGNGANVPAQTITICKQTIPAGGTGFPFSWTIGSSGMPTSFLLNDTQCSVKNVTGMDH